MIQDDTDGDGIGDACDNGYHIYYVDDGETKSTATFTMQNGNLRIAEKTFYYYPATGYNYPESQNKELLLYPNPFADVLTIVPPFNEAVQKLEIYTMEGKLVKAIPVKEPGLIHIQRGNLTPGIYMLRLHGEKIHVATIAVQ